MCGRFAQFSALETLRRYFPIDTVDCDVAPSYNVAPTQEILTILRQEGHRLKRHHWGLVPSWAKDRSGASRLINARSETAAKKPSFRSAFRHRRCLIPADGFYEWKKDERRKQPYFITLASGVPFAFAGLWEAWRNRDGTRHNSCTVLTIESEGYVGNIHHRMPVILQPDAYRAWLNPANTDTSMLEDLVREAHVRGFIGHPVSTLVNSPRNDSPACIAPLAAKGTGDGEPFT